MEQHTHLALTSADTHMAVFTVEGVHEQPQTLQKREFCLLLFRVLFLFLQFLILVV